MSCQYAVPPPPPPYIMLDTTGITVAYTANGGTQTLTQAPSNDCSNGGQWYWSAYDTSTPPQPTELGLCPDMCTQAQTDLDASISITFECLGEV